MSGIFFTIIILISDVCMTANFGMSVLNIATV